MYYFFQLSGQPKYFSKHIYIICNIILYLIFKNYYFLPNTAGIFLHMTGYYAQVFTDQVKIYPGKTHTFKHVHPNVQVTRISTYRSAPLTEDL